jgi:HNH endonuclease
MSRLVPATQPERFQSAQPLGSRRAGASKMSTFPISPTLRISQHLEIQVGTDSCWIWTGCLSSQGAYPGFTIGDRFYYVYRYIWEQANGEIPAGMQIHHRCNHRRCCRLSHLELLTVEEHKALHKEQAAKARAERARFWKHLFDDLGMSMASIAESVGYSYETVRRYIYDARQSEMAMAEAA